MKILVISTDICTTKDDIQRKQQILKKAVSADVEIIIEYQKTTNIVVDSNVDVVITGPETIQRARQAEIDGYDAICLYCGSDPAYDACRELLHIPVVGAAHASFAIASCLGYQYSFITTSHRRIPQKKEFARSCGIDISRLASVRAINYDLSIPEDNERRRTTIELLSNTAKKCAIEDGADVVILGCLSFAGMGSEISLLSGIPVVDPAFAMISLAEALCRQGISHSKIAYPFPPKAKRSWASGTLNTI